MRPPTPAASRARRCASRPVDSGLVGSVMGRGSRAHRPVCNPSAATTRNEVVKMLVFRPPKRVPTLRLRVSRVEDIAAGTGDFCIAGFRQPRSSLPPFVQGGSQLKAVAGLRNHWLSGGLPDVDAHRGECSGGGACGRWWTSPAPTGYGSAGESAAYQSDREPAQPGGSAVGDAGTGCSTDSESSDSGGWSHGSGRRPLTSIGPATKTWGTCTNISGR
jgi:hypothetical protein